MPVGKRLRMARLFERGRALIAAYSHGILYGPIPGLNTVAEYRANLQAFVAGGATGIMITPGYLRVFADVFEAPVRPGLVVTVSYVNRWRAEGARAGYRPGTGANEPMCDVEQCVRLGADAVHAYAFLGQGDPWREAEEVRRVGLLSCECEKMGMPLLVEPLFDGPQVHGASNTVDLASTAARIAAEAGADFVKVEHPGTEEGVRQVVEACGVPVLMVGGAAAAHPLDFLRRAHAAMHAGARGVVVGRNLFSAGDVAGMVRAVRSVIIGDEPPERAVAHVRGPA